MILHMEMVVPCPAKRQRLACYNKFGMEVPDMAS